MDGRRFDALVRNLAIGGLGSRRTVLAGALGALSSFGARRQIVAGQQGCRGFGQGCEITTAGENDNCCTGLTCDGTCFCDGSRGNSTNADNTGCVGPDFPLTDGPPASPPPPTAGPTPPPIDGGGRPDGRGDGRGGNGNGDGRGRGGGGRGPCGGRCGGNETCCDGRCVKTKQDRDHCGGCGKRCRDGEDCRDGTCVSTAPPAADDSPAVDEARPVVVRARRDLRVEADAVAVDARRVVDTTDPIRALTGDVAVRQARESVGDVAVRTVDPIVTQGRLGVRTVEAPGAGDVVDATRSVTPATGGGSAGSSGDLTATEVDARVRVAELGSPVTSTETAVRSVRVAEPVEGPPGTEVPVRRDLGARGERVVRDPVEGGRRGLDRRQG